MPVEGAAVGEALLVELDEARVAAMGVPATMFLLDEAEAAEEVARVVCCVEGPDVISRRLVKWEEG